MHNLNDEEVADYSKQLADATQDVCALEDEKKTIGQDYNAKISRQQSLARDMARKVSTRKEMRDTECRWRYDWEADEKHLIRLDTYECIESDTIKEYERQQELAIDKEDTTAETETEPPEYSASPRQHDAGRLYHNAACGTKKPTC